MKRAWLKLLKLLMPPPAPTPQDPLFFKVVQKNETERLVLFEEEPELHAK